MSCIPSAFVLHSIQFDEEPKKNASTEAHKEDKFALSDLYFEAMLKAGKGRKEEALSLIQNGCLRSSMEWIVARPDNIEAFFDKLFVDFIASKPQLISGLCLLESIGICEHNKHLNDYSIEAIEKEISIAKQNLLTLETYPFESLTEEQQVSYNIFHQWLTRDVEKEPFLYHEYPVTQLFGVISSLSETFTQYHKLYTEEDFNTYLERLHKIPIQLKKVETRMIKQYERGIAPPKFAIEKVLNNLKLIAESLITEHPFYQYFTKHFLKLKGEDHNLPEKLSEILETIVAPAYQSFFFFLTDFSKRLHSEHGAQGLPQGDTYYAYCLKKETTTDMTPEEIYQLGLQEVASVQSEMRELLKSVGIEDDNVDIGQLMAQLNEDKIHFYPNTEEGKQECLQGFHSLLERSRKELSPYFDFKSDMPVKIIPIPKHEEEGMPGGYYYEPSLDGSREGAFYVNLQDMNLLPKFGMPTLLVHEAEPGHHFQLTLQAKSSIPLLRKLGPFTAYVEGWALYAEKFAFEKGFYTSVYDKLGHLQDELLRAVRLVVDPAIHSKGWSKEKAIDYMQKQTGYERATVVSEIERYFVWPGQACAYKIGQLKILELRKMAREKLGERFDIRAFHNAILKLGACPLSVLTDVIMKEFSL